jgi:hypothetical protein
VNEAYKALDEVVEDSRYKISLLAMGNFALTHFATTEIMKSHFETE